MDNATGWRDMGAVWQILGVFWLLLLLSFLVILADMRAILNPHDIVFSVGDAGIYDDPTYQYDWSIERNEVGVYRLRYREKGLWKLGGWGLWRTHMNRCWGDIETFTAEDAAHRYIQETERELRARAQPHTWTPVRRK